MMERRFGRMARSGAALLLAFLLCLGGAPSGASACGESAPREGLSALDHGDGAYVGVEKAASRAAAPKAGGFVNVKDHGAVGDAKYQHHFADSSASNAYHHRTGYYSKLSVAERTEAGVKYEVPDEAASVRATDDSAAFEAAIAAGGGALYLPHGDYMVSQATAAKITALSGTGRIWLKEWNGGDTWYLNEAMKAPLVYANDGWIDAAHFDDEIWRGMHWISDLPGINGWDYDSEFTGNISPKSEFPFDETRDSLNTWLTVRPAVSKDNFKPAEVTVCLADVSVKYTTAGSNIWNEGASGVDKKEGAMFDLSWNEESRTLSSKRWSDEDGVTKITLKKDDFFKNGVNYGFHCWTRNASGLRGRNVEYVAATARVWVESARDASGRSISPSGWLTCDIGSDMRPEGGTDIREACGGTTKVLTGEPMGFYAYTERNYDLIDYLEDTGGSVTVTLADGSGNALDPVDNVVKVDPGTDYSLWVEIATDEGKGLLGDSTYVCDIPYIDGFEDMRRDIAIDGTVIGSFSFERTESGGRLEIVTNDKSNGMSNLRFTMTNTVQFIPGSGSGGGDRFWPFGIKAANREEMLDYTVYKQCEGYEADDNGHVTGIRWRIKVKGFDSPLAGCTLEDRSIEDQDNMNAICFDPTHIYDEGGTAMSRIRIAYEDDAGNRHWWSAPVSMAGADGKGRYAGWDYEFPDTSAERIPCENPACQGAPHNVAIEPDREYVIDCFSLVSNAYTSGGRSYGNNAVLRPAVGNRAVRDSAFCPDGDTNGFFVQMNKKVDVDEAGNVTWTLFTGSDSGFGNIRATDDSVVDGYMQGLFPRYAVMDRAHIEDINGKWVTDNEWCELFDGDPDSGAMRGEKLRVTMTIDGKDYNVPRMTIASDPKYNRDKVKDQPECPILYGVHCSRLDSGEVELWLTLYQAYDESHFDDARCHRNRSGEFDEWLAGICECIQLQGDDIRLTVNYKTPVKKMDALSGQYGGSGHVIRNNASFLASRPGTTLADGESWLGGAHTTQEKLIPALFKKDLAQEPSEANNYVARFELVVNEDFNKEPDNGYSDMGDGDAVITDTMTNLRLFPETLEIRRYGMADVAEDGNLISEGTLLTEGTDYAMAYSGGELKITLHRPGRNMYRLAYDAQLERSSYSNSAKIVLADGRTVETPVISKKVDFSASGDSFKVRLTKTDADSGDTLPGAKFGLYGADGRRMAQKATGADGMAEFSVDVSAGVEFSAHKLYYLLEEEAPDGYEPDGETKHWFMFCSSDADGGCADCGKAIADCPEGIAQADVTVTRINLVHIPVTNERVAGFELPKSGGSGTAPCIVLGSTLALAAGLLLIRRRRQRP